VDLGLVLPISKTLDFDSKTLLFFFQIQELSSLVLKTGLHFIYTLDNLLYYTLYVHKVQKLIKINI
jgi:hypothetical protein